MSAPHHLPFLGISGHALLALLTKWATAAPRWGGLQTPRHRLASGDLLLALLTDVRTLLPDGVLFIDLSATWRIVAPRPQTFDREVPLRIGSDGTVDFDKFIDEATTRYPCSKRCWWHSQALHDFARNLATYNLYDIFCASAMDKRMLSLHKQLVWGLDQLLEKRCRQLIPRKKASEGIPVRAPNMEGALGSGPALDRQLVQYVESSKRYANMLNLRSLSLCTDKASVGGLGSGVQCTVMVLGQSNVAVVAAPQVDRSLGPEWCHPRRIQKVQFRIRWAAMGRRPEVLTSTEALLDRSRNGNGGVWFGIG